MTDIRQSSVRAPNFAWSLATPSHTAFHRPFITPPMLSWAWILYLRHAGVKNPEKRPYGHARHGKTSAGLSVTIPHKVKVMNHVDEIDPVDRAIGAINTVVHEPDGLIGLNTDGSGALKALENAGVDMTDKSVLMLGSGGAARAIAFTLAWDNRLSQLRLLDINATMLSQLATDLRSGTKTTIQSDTMTKESLAEAMATADVIIHCTPVGMHPKTEVSLVPRRRFSDRARWSLTWSTPPWRPDC